MARTTETLIDPDDLVGEIEQSLLVVRDSQRLDELAHPEREHSLEQIRRRERTAMFDVTVALLIRLRLSIDADDTRRAVHRVGEASGHDSAAWARGCAEYISELAV